MEDRITHSAERLYDVEVDLENRNVLLRELASRLEQLRLLAEGSHASLKRSGGRASKRPEMEDVARGIRDIEDTLIEALL